MYIKSIVLDGFKSYGNRVEVTGFDQEFNAITGLNGTGKSNILDSICFVLGITNLSNVRAGSLQELIYKHGQAGITKATVSITFDNSDKKQCPIGYENHNEITVTRQVVMGGKNKYLINGINVQNKRVSDLFCSVQLNVNNPHFLIMQGRITKVLNMKPPEILSMVEEAAGTRMYEAKKQAAQKTIEKKDAKLRELNDIIQEDIAPKLQKLQDERSQYQEYQKVVRELENLTRISVAWQYITAEGNAKKSAGKLTDIENDIKSKKDRIEQNKVDSKQLDKQVAELSKKLDEESGSTLKELENQLSSLEKVEAGYAAEMKEANENLTSHEKRARLLERAMTDDDNALRDKKKILDKVSSMFTQLKSASESSAAELTEAQQKFLAVSTGLEDSSGSLQDQLMAAKAAASEAGTLFSQSNLELKHAQTRVAKLQKEFDSCGKQFHKDQAVLTNHQQQLTQLQSEISRLQFDPNELRSLEEQAKSLQSIVRTQKSETERNGSRLQRSRFYYQDPVANFDRRRVYGTVCELLDVVDTKYCTAIETAAGGRLYNVIVDTEVTSKLLLERGNLQQRTTIIPLNKISGSVIDDKTLRNAQRVGGGPERVQLALHLVKYPREIESAMRWVLGSTLVCADLESAKRVTFDPSVRKRCVTLDGDVFEPSGTISGGARQQGGSILLMMQQQKEAESQLASSKAELDQCLARLNGLQQAAEAYQQKQNKYEMMSQELQMTQQRLANTEHAQLHEEIETLKQKIETLQVTKKEAEAKQKEMNAKANELQEKVQDIKGHREREFKKAEAALKKAQKAAETSSSEWKKREQEYETLLLEVQDLEKGVQNNSEQVQMAKDTANGLKEIVSQAKEKHLMAAEESKEMQSRIKKQKAEIASRSTEIAKLQQKKEGLASSSADLELKVKELEFKIKEIQQEAVDCASRMKSLESNNSWLLTERQYFGVSGGAFEKIKASAHAEREAQSAHQREMALKGRRAKLERGLNARAHALLAREEEQYQDVMRKKKIVEGDRAKLVQVMQELDEKKQKTLSQACLQVNKDFGNIFSTLLPGAQARLTPPPGKALLDGLEVKVGFNNQWKESLGELSGGQRSLVALSLVLSMLLFKPAPLYILDEVDAALDLSHTQNIGTMLKEHFRHSQFIIVSLKDGMFNNANVLFRTKFVDGMSTVQRTVNPRR